MLLEALKKRKIEICMGASHIFAGFLFDRGVGAAELITTEDAGDGVFAVVQLLLRLLGDGLLDFGYGSQV